MKPGPYGPFPYSPIIRRPPLEWPGDAHVALWVVPNIEFFSLETRPGGLGPGKIPDIPIWAMRDYGNRVGVFRLMEVLDRYGVRATVALNSDICVHHPEIIEEGEKRRWEWMGHNQTNSRRLNEVPAEEEPTIIRDTLDTIASVSGYASCRLARRRDCKRLGTRSISWRRQVANMSQIGAPTTISPT